MVKKSNGFATRYYTENGTIKNPDISNRRRIYLDTILIYIHPAARRVLKMVFIALILAIIFGSIGQSIRAWRHYNQATDWYSLVGFCNLLTFGLIIDFKLPGLDPILNFAE